MKITIKNKGGAPVPYAWKLDCEKFPRPCLLKPGEEVEGLVLNVSYQTEGCIVLVNEHGSTKTFMNSDAASLEVAVDLARKEK